MFKYLLLPSLILLYSCQSESKLTEGRWTGSLSPMNHPEMQNSVAYDVGYENDLLRISLIGPNGTSSHAENITLGSDTLYFAFSEPEEQTKLDCALAKKSSDFFQGRCTDPNGKWALFTMKAPATESSAN